MRQSSKAPCKHSTLQHVITVFFYFLFYCHQVLMQLLMHSTYDHKNHNSARKSFEDKWESLPGKSKKEGWTLQGDMRLFWLSITPPVATMQVSQVARVCCNSLNLCRSHLTAEAAGQQRPVLLRPAWCGRWTARSPCFCYSVICFSMEFFLNKDILCKKKIYFMRFLK